ncbi:MAG: AAA family ATPase [Candidatus Electrothrix aestuarii]|uniref:AAA family ATPase n=1 Tax=Candidatus Electrothrix aestuarii TaxID=3062594 RepID=A0AAU8LYJ8_9BACT|nr:AAA family ATPase [Candidatus Electrothrix aestuarii]
MITQLEIKNFRGFSEYKIDDVGQVNLLVGTNNCGKTSILEAVHLLKSRGDASALFFLLFRRGERIIQNEEKTSRSTEGDLCRLFHGFRLTPELDLSINSIDHAVESLSISINELQSVQLNQFKELADSIGGYQLDLEWRWGQDGHEKQAYPITYSGGLSYYLMRKMVLARPSTKKWVNVFVPTSSLSPKGVVALFDNVVLSPDEDLVLEAIKIIEPDITRLASLGGIASSDDYPRGGIIVKSSKWEERIPIGNFGDGIWRLLGLILSLVAAKDGTLLFDEIDTGLHHTVMSKMWKLICTTARKLNVQVFATTHSSDCWKTLADNAVEEEFADMPIRIHRIDKNKSKPETFTNREMHLALDQEIEVR